jgi:hypothetical protein
MLFNIYFKNMQTFSANAIVLFYLIYEIANIQGCSKRTEAPEFAYKILQKTNIGICSLNQ